MSALGQKRTCAAHKLMSAFGGGLNRSKKRTMAARFNQYGVILVNPAKHPNVKHGFGQQFINWLVSREGQKAIANYKVKGEQLFFPNATDPSARFDSRPKLGTMCAWRHKQKQTPERPAGIGPIAGVRQILFDHHGNST